MEPLDVGKVPLFVVCTALLSFLHNGMEWTTKSEILLLIWVLSVRQAVLVPSIIGYVPWHCMVHSYMAVTI